MAAAQEYEITGLTPSDFDEWSALFHAYIDFYKSVLPDDQYKKTFERILETREGLDAVVMRETEGDKKMVGLAHFFPQQSPWSEKKFLFLNDLFVDPSVRGKGLGRRLIEAVGDKGRSGGYSRVQWVTAHDNFTAQRLYDKVAESIFKEYRMKLD
ncbi:hypothetical protein SAPIO_CDS1934 [Scedosporium apiospermum]|uniref:N-acetyltransferase domain-containing protein n=1 Tax=Pseudallescheria apiosperma TaxID=563466 RepID=A0A084GE31_PSEDA|nr:uncharacterized protein SAPIO_CDS1934 [Scedosporium apiospermum]KEZ45593.1 hypothetical protein SAPIO_CDS1934 [Scedosporium apiospermum]